MDERANAKGSRCYKLGSIIDLGSFVDKSLFEITTGSGEHIRLEISEQFLEVVRSALLEIIWSFEWIDVGNIRVYRPSRKGP